MNGPGTRTGGADGGIGGRGGSGTGPGPGPGPDGATSGRPVEDRLRGAFAARAESIVLRDLRPAAPPGPHTRGGRLPGPMRPWLRRFGLPLAAAAATAAVVIGFLTAAPGAPERPLPATPPSPVGPAPSPSSGTGPSPVPSPSHPSRVPPRTAGPSRSATPNGTPVPPPRPSPTDTSTPRPPAEPGGGPARTTAAPSTPPSATPTTRRGSTRAAPGRGGTPSSPPSG
ncbi:hypothetical protein ACWIG5_02495 [Streptomyces lydicus]